MKPWLLKSLFYLNQIKLNEDDLYHIHCIYLSLQKKVWDNKDSVLFEKFPTNEKFNKYIEDELKSFTATLKLPSDFREKFQCFSDNFNVLTDKVGYQIVRTE